MKSCVIIGLNLVLTTLAANFEPYVDVKFCGPDRMVVNVTTLESGGLVYIRGTNVNYVECTRPLQQNLQNYEFIFNDCGIQWLSNFKLVVQRYQDIQTGSDLVIPIHCRYNLSDVTVSSDYDIVDDTDDTAQDTTLRPPVFMILGDEDGVLGTNEVMLGYRIYMQIYLDPKHRSEFDIKTSNCSASGQQLITDYCPENGDVFPGFTSPVQGMLLTPYFGAFRTTEMSGGTVSMTFICTVSICKGECTPAHGACEGGSDGFGRRKRQARSNRDVRRSNGDVLGDKGEEDEIVEAVQVEAVLRVVDPARIHRGGGTTNMCVNDGDFIGIVAAISSLLLVLIVCCTVCCCLLMRRRKKDQGRRQVSESLNFHNYSNPNFLADIVRTSKRNLEC